MQLDFYGLPELMAILSINFDMFDLTHFTSFMN